MKLLSPKKIEELIRERDYYKTTLHEMADNMEANTVRMFRLGSICRDIIMSYSNHKDYCLKEKEECTCGYDDIMIKFKELTL